MNALLPMPLAHRFYSVAAILAAISAGLIIPFVVELSLQLQIILAIGCLGAATCLFIPNRRIALVCAWILAHPLSLEKVFEVFNATNQGFIPPAIVLSGSDLIFYFLLALLVFEALVLKRKTFFFPSASLPMALLTLWVVISFITATPTSEGVLQVVHWIKMLIFMITISSCIKTRDELLTVIVALAIAVTIQSGIVGSTFVLGQRFGFSDKISSANVMSFSSGGSSSITRATGTFGHVNQQAMLQTFYALPVIALLVARNWKWRIFAAIALLGSFAAVLLTFSRAAWIAWFFSSAILLAISFLFKRINKAGQLGLACVMLAVTVILGLLAEPVAQRITKGDDGASASRLRMMKLAFEHTIRNPIAGVGPGNFVNAKIERVGLTWIDNTWLDRGFTYKTPAIADLELYPIELDGKTVYAPGAVHNKYLLVLSELGLVGFGLFTWWQWRIIKAALRSLRSKDNMLWWCGVSLFATYCAILIEFMLDLFYDDKTVGVPMLVYALILSLDRIVAQEKQREASS